MYSKAIKLALSILLLGNPVIAQQRVEKIDILEGQKTYKNYVKNPSAIKNTNGTSVSSASIARDTDAADKLDGIASFTCDASAQNGYCLWQVNTINEGDKTGNCEVSATFKGDASLYSLRLTDGTNVLYDLPLKNQADWGGASFNYPCGATRDVRLVQTTAGTAPAVNIGRIYYGPATNLVNASVVTDWVSYTPTVTSYSGGATNYTVSGSYKRVGDSIIIQGKIVFSSAPAAFTGLLISLPSGLTRDASKTAAYTSLGNFFSWDTGNNSFPGTIFSDSVSSVSLVPAGVSTHAGTAPVLNPSLSNAFPFSFNTNDSITWISELIPLLGWSSSSMAVIPSLPSAPTIQRFTSGSGTYTTPQGVKYIKVRMVGGGGGGQASATAGWGNNGGPGTNTNFGSSLLSAYGGGAGGLGGAFGGGYAINPPAINILGMSGSEGNGGQRRLVAPVEVELSSGSGGSSPFGGSGRGTLATHGGSAAPNSGSGGGGGSLDSGNGAGFIGGGGASGGYIEAKIDNPLPTYSYSVGAGGAGGAGGVYNGGAGGSGVIIVEEYYHTENAPILVGSGMGDTVSVRATNSAGPSIPNATSTTFVGNSEEYDYANSFDHPTGIFTAPAAGLYQVNIAFNYSSAAWAVDSYYYSVLKKNGSDYALLSLDTVAATQTTERFASGTAKVKLAVGETIRVDLAQYRGSATNLKAVASQNYIEITRIGSY